MNMDFEQLLKQEVQKAARQDYEEITAKAQDYPYKFSKEFNEKMKGIIREEKKKAKKIQNCSWSESSNLYKSSKRKLPAFEYK